jgi:telomerase reverse transcriptase
MSANAQLDTDHNHLDTVYLNVFINFALTAMKISHYFEGKPLEYRRSKLVYGE